MAAGEVLTGGLVSWHDGFIHVAVSCSPVISFSFGCALLLVLAFVERFWWPVVLERDAQLMAEITKLADELDAALDAGSLGQVNRLMLRAAKLDLLLATRSSAAQDALRKVSGEYKQAVAAVTLQVRELPSADMRRAAVDSDERVCELDVQVSAYKAAIEMFKTSSMAVRAALDALQTVSNNHRAVMKLV